MRKFLLELRRRNVLRITVAYLAMAWLGIQVLETVFPIFDVPDVYIRWIIIVLAILLVPVMALSWAFEWSQAGIESQSDLDRDNRAGRTGTRTLDRAIIVILSLAVMYFAVDKFLMPSIGHGVGEPTSIAVMPFADRTGTEDRAYLADGIAEELLTLLARNTALRVAARSSSFRYRNATLPVEQIAARLKVSHLLEGSIRMMDDRVRITVQIISGRDGYNVWSNVFDRDADDLFSVVSEIKDAVEKQLAVSESARSRISKEPDPDAYMLALRAAYMGRQSTAEAIEEAIDLNRQALEIDPNFAFAWANLAALYSNQVNAGHRDYEEGYRKARDAALNAVAADPDFPPGYKALSYVSFYFEAELPAAVAAMQRAIDLDPTELAVLADAAILLLNIGQLEESIKLREYLVERSPVDVISIWGLALAYRYLDRLEEAALQYRRVGELSPDHSALSYNLGETFLLMGRYEEALEFFVDEEDEAYRLKGLALARHGLGQPAESDKFLAQLESAYGDRWPSEVAHVYAFRGELDAAFEWLEREYATYGPGGWGEWQLQRLYDNLRDDPRWTAFLRRTGTAPEQLARFNLRLPVDLYR